MLVAGTQSGRDGTTDGVLGSVEANGRLRHEHLRFHARIAVVVLVATQAGRRGGGQASLLTERIQSVGHVGLAHAEAVLRLQGISH